MTAKDIADAIDDAEDYQLEPPRPLMRELPPAVPFPVDALGGLLADAAKAIHDKTQAPMAICAQSVLAAVTLAVQGHADVELPTGQKKPLSVYYMTIAESGERKSGCDTEALKPIRTHEWNLREKYELDQQSYENNKLAWEKTREANIKKNRLDYSAAKEALDSYGVPPTAPIMPMLLCPEPTYEGLCKLYRDGMPSIGLFAAEGGQFIGGHGMGDDAKLRTATGLSAIWDGEPIRRVRGGDGIQLLFGKRLTVHLMCQPDIAAIILNDSLIAGQGLLSRMLVSAPQSAAGTRLWRDAAPKSDVVLEQYNKLVMEIMRTPFHTFSNKPNELDPRVLPLSKEARKLWIAYADEVEMAMSSSGEFASIKNLANKLPEYAARLAGVLTLVENMKAVSIPKQAMVSGIKLAKHYASEALRVSGASRINAELLWAKRLLIWLKDTWEDSLISLPDIYQRAPIADIRDQATAFKIARILEEHGYLVCIAEGAVVAGTKRRQVWKIVK